MSRYVWLVLLVIPPWIATRLDAPKWILMLAAAPFFIRAATLGDEPDEYLLGERFTEYRGWVWALLLVGAVVLGVVMLVVFMAAAGTH